MRVILFTSLLFLVGCNSAPETPQEFQNRYTQLLPTDSTNILDKGNGWVEFELDGNRFLFRRIGHGTDVTECNTQIK